MASGVGAPLCGLHRLGLFDLGCGAGSSGRGVSSNFRDSIVAQNVEAICFGLIICNTFCNSESLRLVALLCDLVDSSFNISGMVIDLSRGHGC